MKIIFLCGSLEPGRDGVGDYVSRLSTELLRTGHQVMAIGLNDQYIKDLFLSDEIVVSLRVNIIRLPSIWTSNKRFHHAKYLIDEFNPDWLSLQFVPFAFHDKGLPFFLINQLLFIGNKRKWHIMFHELWVGMNKESSFKKHLWGMVQRYLIKILITKLKPQVIHTQTILYKVQLERMHYKCHLLPLFSNITNLSDNNYYLPPKIRDDHYIDLVVFGYIHPRAQIETLAKEASLYAAQHLCTVRLIIVGRSGPELGHWRKKWQEVGLSVIIMGEQSSESVSDILRSATLGITTTPLALIGKSGTVAAMLEHRLLVLCLASPWTASGINNPLAPTSVFPYEYGKFASYLGVNSSQSTYSTLSDVAQQFTDCLTTFNGVNQRSTQF